MGRYWKQKIGWLISSVEEEVEKKKNYPKCVPIAKATRMTKGQKAGAVRRKRAKGNTGPKPSNVKTFA